MSEIKLSTGKLCPKCNHQSLEEGYSENTVLHEKNFVCVALCGMQFALNRLRNGKIHISYNKPNEIYLRKRFKFIDIDEEV